MEIFISMRRGVARDVEYHEMWSTMRREIPRDVKCHETYHVCTQQLIQSGLVHIATRNNNKP